MQDPSLPALLNILLTLDPAHPNKFQGFLFCFYLCIVKRCSLKFTIPTKIDRDANGMLQDFQ